MATVTIGYAVEKIGDTEYVRHEAVLEVIKLVSKMRKHIDADGRQINQQQAELAAARQLIAELEERVVSAEGITRIAIAGNTSDPGRLFRAMNELRHNNAGRVLIEHIGLLTKALAAWREKGAGENV